MTNTQKIRLSSLNHKYRTIGLNMSELETKKRLEAIDASETSHLASKLQGWAKRFDTKPIAVPFEPITTVYVNSVL